MRKQLIGCFGKGVCIGQVASSMKISYVIPMRQARDWHFGGKVIAQASKRLTSPHKPTEISKNIHYLCSWSTSGIGVRPDLFLVAIRDAGEVCASSCNAHHDA